jgi:hypothetical protein
LATFFLLLTWCGFVALLSLLPGAGLVTLSFFVDSPPTRALLLLGGVILAVLLLVVVVLYLMLQFALVSEVVVIERLSLVRAMRRSASLMAGRVGRTLIDNCKLRASVLFAVNFCISVSVMIVTSVPTFLVNSAYGVSPFDPERYDPALVPLWASVPVEVLSVFVEAAVGPFGLLAVIVFYFDIRIKREGFDLEFLAGRIEAPK